MRISKKLLTIIGALILVAVVAVAAENNMMKKTTKKIVAEDTMKKEPLVKMEEKFNNYARYEKYEELFNYFFETFYPEMKKQNYSKLQHFIEVTFFINDQLKDENEKLYNKNVKRFKKAGLDYAYSSKHKEMKD
ncbi:hypothetical protein [Leptotrichia trevisanii]|uniref:hypothetical protein n=1 Tax=Leptotrichia trevisanii TaxID=109328 RepID=UPI0026F067AF|nr:hypothetical protein [Leptotrichia trevisanii]